MLWRHACQLQGRSGHKPGLPPMLFLTEAARVSDPFAVAQALPAGAGVILRDYDLDGREQLATDLAIVCRQNSLLFLVAGHEHLAGQVGADGMHFPQYAIGQIAPVRYRHPDWWLTAAAHSISAAHQARTAGADAVLVSPVFSTLSHPGASHMGVHRFASIARTSEIPAYALGGIDATNAHRLRGSRAYGIAAISGLATEIK